MLWPRSHTVREVVLLEGVLCTFWTSGCAFDRCFLRNFLSGADGACDMGEPRLTRAAGGVGWGGGGLGFSRGFLLLSL